MIFVPILKDKLINIPETGFLFHRANNYINPHNMEIEGCHIHDFYEIYLNISGDVSFLHNKNVYRIEPGDIIFSKPGEFHYCIYNSAAYHDHCCMWFNAGDSSDIASYIEKRHISGHIRPDNAVKGKLFNIVDDIEKSSDRFEKTALFMNFLTLLSRSSEPISSEIPGKLQEILDYIDDNFSEIHFAEELAQKFHISISTMNRWFREYINLPPTTIIRAKKLAYAEKLIRSDCSVTDACFMSGFSDCSRFIAAFRKNYGMTPLQYKKAKSPK